MSLSGIIAEFVRIPIIFTFCTVVILFTSWKIISLKGLKELFIVKEEKKEEEVLISNP